MMKKRIKPGLDYRIRKQCPSGKVVKNQCSNSIAIAIELLHCAV